jgi:hypothetical protein
MVVAKALPLAPPSALHIFVDFNIFLLVDAEGSSSKNEPINPILGLCKISWLCVLYERRSRYHRRWKEFSNLPVRFFRPTSTSAASAS